jgi:hypothetical protein
MITLENDTKTKAVKITVQPTGDVIAMHVQTYNGEEQVLKSKTFKRTRTAVKWGKKILS